MNRPPNTLLSISTNRASAKATRRRMNAARDSLVDEVALDFLAYLLGVRRTFGDDDDDVEELLLLLDASML